MALNRIISSPLQSPPPSLSIESSPSPRGDMASPHMLPMSASASATIASTLSSESNGHEVDVNTSLLPIMNKPTKADTDAPHVVTRGTKRHRRDALSSSSPPPLTATAASQLGHKGKGRKEIVTSSMKSRVRAALVTEVNDPDLDSKQSPKRENFGSEQVSLRSSPIFPLPLFISSSVLYL
jgi:hypothetical protein